MHVFTRTHMLSRTFTLKQGLSGMSYYNTEINAFIQQQIYSWNPLPVLYNMNDPASDQHNVVSVAFITAFMIFSETFSSYHKLAFIVRIHKYKNLIEKHSSCQSTLAHWSICLYVPASNTVIDGLIPICLGCCKSSPSILLDSTLPTLILYEFGRMKPIKLC